MRQRNAALLAAYQQQRTIARRNAVVQANLPLVWQVARQESLRSGHDFEDLVQVGCIGLIKAVERYDAARGNALSSVAMPFIQGAMRQYLRDRCQPMRASRTLRELHQRGDQLQLQRQQQQRAPLSEPELAAALGCDLARWREAQALQRALRLASLDQPHSGDGPYGGSLLEQLVDAGARDGYAAAIRSERRRLLRRQLWQLERSQRRLLLARVLQQRSWRELGLAMGLSAKVTQRRAEALLRDLAQQLGPQLRSA